MGLNLMAVSRCRLVQATSTWSESFEREENVVFVDQAKGLPDRLDGFSEGYYRFEGKELSFHAGSCLGYNRWREWLCRQALGVEPRDVWHSYERYDGRPFVELIHFSDSEGAIGPVTSAKLARDFAEHREHILDEAESYGAEMYHCWGKAFQLASDQGFVIFR